MEKNNINFLIAGIALMIYSYFITSSLLLIFLGVAIIIIPIEFR